MSDPVVQISQVTKAFRKHHRRKHFLTLKSTLVRDIWDIARGRKKQPPDAPDDHLFWALKGVDLSVMPGETIGLIGSNGSGKSTLLKLIAGILKPTRGSVSVRGRLSALIELGAGFHPEISGRENIFINGIMLGLSKQEIRDKFDEIVDFAELREFIDNPVRTYSSGMFMRLGFAVAVHVNPDVLLIDEVLAVGDQSFIHKCLERIFDFKRRKKTIILVSHDLGAVEKLCNRVMWLSEGKPRRTGAPREVIGAYLLAVARREEKRYATQHQEVTASLENLAAENEPAPPAEKADTSSPESESDRRKRWGNRKVEITHVTVKDAAGKERYVFQTGEDVLFHIRYHAKETVKRPVFGIGFFLRDGTWCYGTNTFIERKRIRLIQGEGWIEIRFPKLNFLQNTYLVDVAVHAEDGTPYDYHSRMYTLAFRSDIEDSGIYRPDHLWRFCNKLTVTDTMNEEDGTDTNGGFNESKKDG